MAQRIGGLPVGSQGMVLADAFSALSDLYRRVDEHAARLAEPLELPCGPGCSACCRQSVFVTPLEALYLLDHLQESVAPKDVHSVVLKAVTIVEREHPRIMSFGHPTCPGGREPGAEDRAPGIAPPDRVSSSLGLRFDCPLLDATGKCIVYPARELRARLFAVSVLRSRGDEYYACPALGRHLDGREVRLMDAETVQSILHLHPLTDGEQVLPYYLWRYASFLTT